MTRRNTGNRLAFVRGPGNLPHRGNSSAKMGSGLGLSQAFGVARQSGGDSAISSTVGEGTTVEIYLPRSVAKPLSSRDRPRTTESTAKRGMMVLVAEDQPDLREVAVAHLEAFG